MEGEGHPLPAGREARQGEIPEDLIDEKGCQDDPAGPAPTAGEAVTPEGESYTYLDNGRAENVETGDDRDAPPSAPGTSA